MTERDFRSPSEIAHEATFGSQIRNVRISKGLSLREVARSAGISPAYLIALEKDENPKTHKPSIPSPDKKSRLLSVLGIPMEGHIERENFHVRIELKIKAEGGREVVEMINNFLNDPNIRTRATLVGMTIVKDGIHLQRVDQPEISRAISTLKNPLTLADQERRSIVINSLIESVKSGSEYVIGMDTSVKLVRSLNGLTKENLYYWEKKGYIHPNMLQRGEKKGRIFPTSEAFKVAYIWQFLQEGFGLPTAARMAEQELLKIKESQPR